MTYLNWDDELPKTNHHKCDLSPGKHFLVALLTKKTTLSSSACEMIQNQT